MISLCSNIKAQSKKDSVKFPKATISVKEGATIFSTDDSFNDQISTHKIIRDEANVAVKKDKKGKSTVEMSTPKPGSKNLSEKEPKKNNRNLPKDSTKSEKKKVSFSVSFSRFSDYC